MLDFYAVLQVAPEAESEVIDAAYRQLMRKYHPDLAGDNGVIVDEYTERAKVINQAYAVLRDSGQRQAYDRMRSRLTADRPAAEPARSTPPRPTYVQYAPEPEPEFDFELEPTEERSPSAFWSALSRPLDALSTAYFLLPGPYEWEARGQRDFALTGLIPPLGVVLWLATTGRLAPVLGHSPYALLALWLVVGVILVATHWTAAPRLAIAGGAMLVLMSGLLDASLQAKGVPLWLVWGLLVCVSVVVAARQFLFGILPAIGLCWLISRVV
jgi:hypothetical protein